MKVLKKDLLKNNLALTIELNQNEIQPYLDKAALRLAQKSKIPGFRPGKAPYNLVKNQLGEMSIYQEALESILSYGFYEAVVQNKLQTIGQPDIKLEKFAPGNPVVFTATTALLPEVKIGDWKKLSVAKKTVEVKNEDIDQTLARLQEMQVKETIADRPAKKGDKVEIDFEVHVNKVLVEGGKSYKYPVIIGQNSMIPGFEEKLLGHKAGGQIDFELKFPDKYFQKNMAGRLADFKVRVVNVYNRELPELNDAFAKTIGFENLEKLKDQLKQNIRADKEFKETERAEKEALRTIIGQSTFGDIPAQLLDNEIHKMIHELEHSLGEQGMDIANYLKSINKTHEDMRHELEPQAIERIKAALVLRTLVTEEKISTSQAEAEAELKKQSEHYKNNHEALKNIQHPEYKNQMANMMTNQKALKLIKDSIVK